MKPTVFAQTYLSCQEDIIRILKSRRIFDEDRLHDTYIALYDHKPHPKPSEFVTTFVSFYINLSGWQNTRESCCEPHDNAQLAALNVIDDTDWPQRERSLQFLEKLLSYYYTHPQPDERDHRRACRILRLFMEGLSEYEISHRLKISQPAVCQSLKRTVERLKVITRILYNRGASQKDSSL